MIRVGGVLSAALLAGCATVTTGTEFDASSEQAFVLVVAEDLRLDEYKTSDFTFENVDLGANAFLGNVVVVRFGPVERLLNGEEAPSLDSDELARSRALQARDVRFAGQFDVPGDYALMLRRDENARPRFESENTLCFAGETNVFRLEPGTINIVPLGRLRGADAVNRDAVRRDVADVLAGYPGMTAPVEFAEIVQAVRFEMQDTLLGTSCLESIRSFTVVSGGGG